MKHNRRCIWPGKLLLYCVDHCPPAPHTVNDQRTMVSKSKLNLGLEQCNLVNRINRATFIKPNFSHATAMLLKYHAKTIFPALCCQICIPRVDTDKGYNSRYGLSKLNHLCPIIFRGGITKKLFYSFLSGSGNHRWQLCPKTLILQMQVGVKIACHSVPVESLC